MQDMRLLASDKQFLTCPSYYLSCFQRYSTQNDFQRCNTQNEKSFPIF
jgi:hypothetical protein